MKCSSSTNQRTALIHFISPIVCVSPRARVCVYVDLSAAYNRQLKVMMMNSLHIHQMASALDQRKELTQMNTQCTYTCIECI